MVDQVRRQPSGRHLRSDTLDQLPARRVNELDLHEREAPVEGGDDVLFDFLDLRGVVDESAIPARSLDQRVGRFETRNGGTGGHRREGRRSE